MTPASTTPSSAARRQLRRRVLRSSVLATVLFAACAAVTAGYTHSFAEEEARFDREQQRLNAVSRRHVRALRDARDAARPMLSEARPEPGVPSVADQS